MKVRVKDVDLSTGGPLVAILSDVDAAKMDLYPLDRVKIQRLRTKEEVIAVIDISTRGIKPGEVGLFEEVIKELDVADGTHVEVLATEKPKSISYIKKKLEGKTLKRQEINEIIKDVVDNKFSETELTYFVSACYTHSLTMKEAAYLTEAIVENGDQLNFKEKIVVDKHCLSGDTPVMVKNSGKTKVKPISEIINSVFEKCSQNQIRKSEGAEYANENLRNLKVLTHDNNFKVSYQPVSCVVRVKSPKVLYQIKLIGNREVKTTSDHTIFVLKNGKITNIPSKKMKEGDFVIVPSSLQQEKNVNEISIKTDYKIRNYRKFNNKIKITKEFVRLLAYYIAEGFRNYQGVFLNFGAHEKNLIEDSIKCAKKVFNITPTINKPHKTATRVCLYSQTLSKIFETDIKCGDNALNKKLPSFIFDISKDLQIELLRALIKCDGHVRRGYEAEYTTSSCELHNQLKYLLSTLTMTVSSHEVKECWRDFKIGNKTHKSKIRKSYQIYTQAREIFGGRQKANVSFINLIPLKEVGEINTKVMNWMERRRFKRQKYMTKQKLRKFSKYIKSEDVKKILNGDLSVLKVKQVKKIKSTTKYVYDFKVDGYNKFMAGTAPMCIHNCIGGVPGNRTTMIVVPIIAAAGFIMPKTSSRAITSPAGTADVVEVLAPVTLSREKIMEVVKKTNACMVWGGSMNLAGADDKLIRIRHPLRIDPRGMLLASILAKKKAVGATHVLIDIPYGHGAKIETKRGASELGKQFVELGKLLELKVKVVLTDGSQPIGEGIGPVLEASDVISVLKGGGPNDLREKSMMLATEILKIVKVKNAHEKVLELINTGKAYEKLIEIIKMQGGRKHIRFPKPKYFHSVKAEKSGIIKSVNNKGIAKLARFAGCPKDQTAGIYLRVHNSFKVKKGDVMFTLYSSSKRKLSYAASMIKETQPITY